MTVIPIDPRLGDHRQHITLNFIEGLVYYVIDSQYRKSVKLTTFMSEQVTQAENNLDAVALAFMLQGETEADTMFNIFQWVRKNKIWRSDWDNWNKLEYWEDFNTAFKNKYMDCESGSLLMYCLARLCDVSHHNLYLFCSDATDKTGTFGHAYLAYRPVTYPLNFVFLDWCHDYSPLSIAKRRKYTVVDKKIVPYDLTNLGYVAVNSQAYSNLWFAFNEKQSVRNIKLRTTVA
jgi:hypothetical protein